MKQKAREMFRKIAAKIGLLLVMAFLIMPLTEKATAQMSLPILGGQGIQDQLPTPQELRDRNNPAAIAGNNQNSSLALVQNVAYRLIRIILIALQIAAVIYIVNMGIQMMVHMEKEDMFAKHRQSLINAVIGFVILSVGDNAIEIFNPFKTADTGGVALKEGSVSSLFDFSSWQGIILLVKDLIKYSVWTVAVVIIVIIGVKMVISQDKDTKSEQKLLMNVAIGLFIIQIADLIVSPFLVQPAGTTQIPGTVTGDGVTQGSQLLLNVSNVLLYLFAPLAVLGIIVSAFYLLTGGEDKKARAKKTLTGIVFATLVAYSSYTVIAEIVKAFPKFLP